MKSVEGKIIDRIMKVEKSKLIFPEDFQSLGSSEAIRLSLHRFGLIVSCVILI